MIRRAYSRDILSIVDVLDAAIGQMGFADAFGATFNGEDAIRSVFLALQNPAAMVSVVELDETVCGVCWVDMSVVPWNHGARLAREVAWHMHPAFPDKTLAGKWFVRMLDHMMEWSRANGARAFFSAVQPGSAAEKLLARRGVRYFENSCVGALR